MNKTIVELGIVTVALLAISVPNSQGQTNSSMSVSEAIASKALGIIVEYQSVSTVVIKGDEDILAGTPGGMINFWSAIDIAKQYGYALDEITTSGVGSQGNPTRFYAVMSKP